MTTNFKLEAMIKEKNITLADEENMISGTFIIVDIAMLPLFIIWLVNLQKTRSPIFLFSTLAGIACAELHFAISRTFL